jgi:type I restriction enzyme S subunit
MAGEWQPYRLGELLEIKHGFAFEGRFFSDEPVGPILVTPGNFRIGGGFSSEKNRYFAGPVPEGYHLLAGDVVVTMTDLSKAGDTLGYSAVIPADGSFYLHNQRIGKLVLKPGAPTKLSYIHWVMRSPGYRAEVLGSATGSTVRHTSPSRIAAFAFGLPPCGEQEVIAALLGALDDKSELNRRMAETLEAMVRALFQSWFVDFDPVRAKAEGRATGLSDDLAAIFPGSFDAEGKPAGWRREPLFLHAKLISGGTPKTDVPEYWGGGIPWASAKDVSQCADLFLTTSERTITGSGLDHSATRLVPELSTVVVARGATTGRFRVLGRDMAMNQTCYALQSRNWRPFWLATAFADLVESLVHAAHGSVFDTITTRTLEAARVVAGSDQLMDLFEKTVNPLYLRALVACEQSNVLAALRDALLPKLISGELRIEAAERKIAAVA